MRDTVRRGCRIHASAMGQGFGKCEGVSGPDAFPRPRSRPPPVRHSRVSHVDVETTLARGGKTDVSHEGIEHMIRLAHTRKQMPITHTHESHAPCMCASTSCVRGRCASGPALRARAVSLHV